MLADFLDGHGISGFGIPELIAVGGGAPAQLLLSAPASLTGSFLLVLLLAVLFPLGKYLYSKITEHRMATRMAGSNHPAIPAMQYEDPQMPEQRLPEQRLPERRLPEQLEPGKLKKYKPARAVPLMKDPKVREQAVDASGVDTSGVDAPGVDAPRVDTPRVDAPGVDTLGAAVSGASDPGATGPLEGYNSYNLLDSLEED